MERYFRLARVARNAQKIVDIIRDASHWVRREEEAVEQEEEEKEESEGWEEEEK